MRSEGREGMRGRIRGLIPLLLAGWMGVWPGTVQAAKQEWINHGPLEGVIFALAINPQRPATL